jgi:hypothetical protein
MGDEDNGQPVGSTAGGSQALGDTNRASDTEGGIGGKCLLEGGGLGGILGNSKTLFFIMSSKSSIKSNSLMSGNVSGGTCCSIAMTLSFSFL